MVHKFINIDMLIEKILKKKKLDTEEVPIMTTQVSSIEGLVKIHIIVS